MQLQQSLCWRSKDLVFNKFLEMTFTPIYGDSYGERKAALLLEKPLSQVAVLHWLPGRATEGTN
jgi:hypothetical protein